MNIINTAGLLKDLEFVFVLPTVGFVGFALNARISQKTGFTPQKQRIALTFCPLLFAFCTVVVWQDRAVLIALWRTSQVVYSVVYASCGLSVVAGVAGLIRWKLRPSLWRRQT
jgi:hypothetical protein